MALSTSRREVRRHHDVSPARGACVQRGAVPQSSLKSSQIISLTMESCSPNRGPVFNPENTRHRISARSPHGQQRVHGRPQGISVEREPATSSAVKTMPPLRQTGTHPDAHTECRINRDLRPNSEYYITYPFVSSLQTRVNGPSLKAKDRTAFGSWSCPPDPKSSETSIPRPVETNYPDRQTRDRRHWVDCRVGSHIAADSRDCGGNLVTMGRPILYGQLRPGLHERPSEYGNSGR